MATDIIASDQTFSEDGQIVRHVSLALGRLVRHHIKELQAESAVVFDSPAGIDNHEETKLSLYLYQIEHNPWMRNLPPTLSLQQGGGGGAAALSLVPPPLVVDLVYMMVPYGKSSEIELVLADKLVRLFHQVPALEGRWLDPVLRRAGNDCIGIVPYHNSVETLRNLWAGFPGRAYKLTKLYTLSPVRIPAASETGVDMVGTASIDTASQPRPAP